MSDIIFMLRSALNSLLLGQYLIVFIICFTFGILNPHFASAQRTGSGGEAVCIPHFGTPVAGEILSFSNDTLTLMSGSRTTGFALGKLKRVDIFPEEQRGIVFLSMIGATYLGLQLFKGDVSEGYDEISLIPAVSIGVFAGLVASWLRPDSPRTSTAYSQSASLQSGFDSIGELRSQLHSAAADRPRFRFTTTLSFHRSGTEDALSSSALEAGLNTYGNNYGDRNYGALGSSRSFVSPLRAMQLSVVFAPQWEVGLTTVDIGSATYVESGGRASIGMNEGASGCAIMGYGGFSKLLTGKGEIPLYVGAGIACGAAPISVVRYHWYDRKIFDKQLATLLAIQAKTNVQILVGGSLLVGVGFDYLWTSGMELPRLNIPFGPRGRNISFSNASVDFTLGVQL